MRADEFVTERKKRKRKRSNQNFGGYWYPGYGYYGSGYYGSGDGNGGGDGGGGESFQENFADGKVKGKSRPGRVKRSGASCAGSVTSLRQKAKKYSGERGRMYHWCANMKGGRKNESADYLTELNVGNYRMGNTIFKITQHAIDRLQERKVPFPTVNELLRRVSTIRNQIEQLGVGQKLWAYDPSLEISLGLRLLDSGRINVGTAILGSPKHRDSSVPIITLD